jgi:8-oxo-dGTP pyrophosphatase MutT (NUDIX family)
MNQPSPRPIRRAAGLLILTRGQPRRFLLMRHPRRWDLPKGHCEPGETELETALRETEEETGIPASALSIDPEFRFRINYPVTYKKTGDTVFDKHLQFFLAWIDSVVEPRLTEHPDYQWFDWAPPHRIQEKTIDPLLAAVEQHLESR